MLAEFARLETEVLSQRIKSGMEQAKLKGKELDRKRGSVKQVTKILEENKEVVKLIEQGCSIWKIAKLCDVSTTTVQKVKKAKV